MRVRESASAWLEQLRPEPGIQACAIRFPDTQCLTRTLSERITPDQVEAMWHPLFETVKAFNVRRLPVGRLFCKFEHHAVQLCIRPDGVILGILMSRDLAESRIPALRSLMEGFLELDLSRAA